MNKQELNDRIIHAKQDIAWLESIKTNCKTCEHGEDNQCAKFGAIPEHFIEIGCDEWSLDDVPF